MGLFKRATDLVYTLRFLRLLTTPFEKTKAFEHGIIDKFGNVDKNYGKIAGEPDPNKRDKQKKLKKEFFTPFIRLVFNIKKLLAKVPGGSSTLASYAAALFLIKEKYNISDDGLEKALKECNVEPMDLLPENFNTMWMTENNEPIPGVYRIQCSQPKMIIDTLEEYVYNNDQVRIEENSFVGDVFGVNVYKATHLKTMRATYVTIPELKK